MRYGIIDIGSNTIRTVIYEVEGKSIKQLVNEKDFTGIINYIVDGRLSGEGIAAVSAVLGRMHMLCELLHCAEVHAFATEALRKIQNTGEVLEALQKEGLKVRILSGAEEAECDFFGLMSTKSCGTEGVGLDLGGGSGQVFSYKQAELQEFVSMPIGSLVMYNRFVRGIIPTPSEVKEIKKYVLHQLEAYPKLAKLGYNKIYAIGGTARAAAKLHRAFVGGERSICGYQLSQENMEELFNLVTAMDMRGVKLMERVVPERITTLMPGLAVIQAICSYVGAGGIELVKNGVREGYLCRYILNRAEQA